MTKSKVPYNNLPVLPTLIAERVCSEPYTGMEISGQNRSISFVEKTEAARQQMTPEQRREFADLCDTKCRMAYEVGAKWMVQCATTGERGRDQLYVWISHWLASYLNHPESFRRSCQAA